MKVRAYMRVAKSTGRKGYLVQASKSPSQEPLTRVSYGQRQPLPTVAFALDLEIPDAAFARAEQVIAEITIPEDQIAIAAEVKELV